MDEITRQEYLSSMGIQSYFPRYVLPAAKKSEQCEWPEKLSNELGMNVEFKNVESKPASAFTHIKDNAPKSEPEPVLEEAVKPEINKEVEEVRFQLAIIYVNTDTLVLISRPYMHASKSLSAIQKQLFNNIFNALCKGPVNLNPDIKPFQWPFSEASHIEKDGQAATASLGAYLEQLKAKYPFDNLILMGEKIAQFISPSDKHGLTICRSLDEMLKMPKFKREVWLQLKRTYRSVGFLTMADYICRLMKEAELSEVVDLVQNASDFSWSPQNIEGSLRSINDKSFVLYSLSRNDLLAYAVVHNVLDESHLLNIVVDKKERGKGLGLYLLQQLIIFLKDQNQRSVLLEVRASNAAAIKLYESIGFQFDGIRKKLLS